MIKISPDSSAEPLLFTKDTIIIGDGPADSVDISFPAEGLHQNHIKIILKDNEYCVINQANDPFVIWNGQPFWKKKLKIGDTIQIRNHTLRIDQISQEPAKDTVPIVKQVTPKEEPPDDALKVSPLVEEAYNLENHKQQRKPAPPPIKKTPRSSSKRMIKAALVLICILAALFTGIFSEIYFRVQEKADREEMLAAESISDYAMALQYAKVYHIAPQKQSWVDPQFLKNNLVDLLSTTSLPCGNIDSQGQFSNCPYILRFYTNRDFSRFLLIAQPDATFSEWIISKKTLILDSSLMVLHKTADLKGLNRLLSYPTPLDGSNGDEIKRAILQTEVIPLATLSRETGKSEFSTPSLLAYMKPGSENLIYNAPRYHLFGETFLKKAITLAEDKSHTLEMSILQSELDTLAKFHDLVFYSSNGIKEAFKGHKALQKLVIPTNYFTGYLIYSKEGAITNSRIVIDNDLADVGEDHHEEIPPPLIAYEPVITEVADNEEIRLANIFREKVEAAQDEIGPIIQTIFTTLEDTIGRDSLYIPANTMELFNAYLSKQAEMSISLRNMVDNFKAIHPQMKEITIENLLREYGILDFYINSQAEEPEPSLDASHWQALQQLLQFPAKIQPKAIPHFSMLIRRSDIMAHL